MYACMHMHIGYYSHDHEVHVYNYYVYCIIIYVHVVLLIADNRMLNKNTLGVKKVQGQSEATMVI